MQTAEAAPSCAETGASGSVPYIDPYSKVPNETQLKFCGLIFRRVKDTELNLDTLSDMLTTLDDRGHEYSTDDTAYVYQMYIAHNGHGSKNLPFIARAIADMESSGKSAQLLVTMEASEKRTQIFENMYGDPTEKADENHTPLTHLATGVDKLHLGLSSNQEPATCSLNQKHKYLINQIHMRKPTCINWMTLTDMFNHLEDVSDCFWSPEDVVAAYNDYCALIEKAANN